MMCSKTNRKLTPWGSAVISAVLCGFIVLTSPGSLQAQGQGTAAQAQSGVAGRSGPIMVFDGKTKLPEPTPEEKAWRERVLEIVNRPRPASPQDGVVPPMPKPPDPSTPKGASPPPANAQPRAAAPAPSIAVKWPQLLVSANGFLSSSTDGMTNFSSVRPEAFLPPIASQAFCCTESVLYDANRDIFLWLSVYANAEITSATLRIAVVRGDFSALWVYDFRPEFFVGRPGLFNFSHAELDAENLFFTIDLFDPAVSTVVRVSLQEISEAQNITFAFVNTTIQ
jgi:hypothetical protein